MALWVCAGPSGCGTKYAVGLFTCPRCLNTEFYEDGDPMAKISRHGGASDKTVPEPEGGARVTEPTRMTVDKPRGGATVPSREALREHARNLVEPDFSESLAKSEAAEAEQEGGEGSSPGSSSSASTGAQPTTFEPSSKPRRKPARTTASRSMKDQTESSSASSTAGGRETGTSAADGGEESSS